MPIRPARLKASRRARQRNRRHRPRAKPCIQQRADDRYLASPPTPPRCRSPNSGYQRCRGARRREEGVGGVHAQGGVETSFRRRRAAHWRRRAVEKVAPASRGRKQVGRQPDLRAADGTAPASRAARRADHIPPRACGACIWKHRRSRRRKGASPDPCWIERLDAANARRSAGRLGDRSDRLVPRNYSGCLRITAANFSMTIRPPGDRCGHRSRTRRTWWTSSPCKYAA